MASILSIIAQCAVGFAAPSKKNKPEPVFDVFNPMRVDFNIVTPKSFDVAVTKYRNSDASQAVLLYHDYPEAKEYVNTVFQPLAEKVKSVVSLSALDCQKYLSYCKSLDETKSFMNGPVVYLVPPFPRPTKILPSDTDLKDIQKSLLGVIPKHNVTEIKVSAYDDFVSSNPGVPKIIFFTEKPKALSSFYSISNRMHDRLDFAMINMTTPGASKIASRAKLNSFPAIVALSAGVYSPYTGDISNATEIFDWINVRSETFVKGGGYGEGAPVNAPIWTTQNIPELTRDSNGPVCFKQDKFCGVYITTESELSPAELTLLEEASLISTPHTDKDPKVKFSFISLKSEPDFKDLFLPKLEEVKGGQFVLIRPTKMKITAPVEVKNVASITNVIENLKSGNQRFNKLKADKLPFRKRESEKDEL